MTAKANPQSADSGKMTEERNLRASGMTKKETAADGKQRQNYLVQKEWREKWEN